MSEWLILSEEQQYETEQRILHDAQLISGGAKINDLGHLIITAEQYIQLKEEADYIPDISDWLQTDVAALFKGNHPFSGFEEKSLITILQGKNIHTVKDILIRGQRIEGPGLGEIRWRMINDRISDNSYGIEFQPEPTPSFIASICGSLEEVPALCISRLAKDDISIQAILSAAEADGTDGVRALIKLPKHRIYYTPSPESRPKYARNSKHFVVRDASSEEQVAEDLLRTEEIIQNAQAFAQEFMAAKSVR